MLNYFRLLLEFKGLMLFVGLLPESAKVNKQKKNTSCMMNKKMFRNKWFDSLVKILGPHIKVLFSSLATNGHTWFDPPT